MPKQETKHQTNTETEPPRYKKEKRMWRRTERFQNAHPFGPPAGLLRLGSFGTGIFGNGWVNFCLSTKENAI